MNFKTHIEELRHDGNFSIKIEGSKLPNTPSVFFRAKQEEIYRQYETARLFLHEMDRGETDTTAWDYWFSRFNDPKLQNVFILLFSEKMFEASLMFYNVVVDLSWVLCYVCAEYVTYENDKSITFEKLMTIEEAYGLIRIAEENIENPNAKGNPFKYLKKMRPEFTKAIDLVLEFWKVYSETPIRSLYNFIKHRGKPLYEEINNESGAKLMGMIVGGKSCPTDVRDVQKALNLKESIEQLVKFDDEVLFPYIKELLHLIEKVVEPSPYVT